ncbi:MAG: 4Fe-4S dicluster domain-containing protein [Chloroflexota bacterium]
MMPLTTLILLVLSASSLLSLGGFALVSFREGERRAAALATILAVTVGGTLALGALLPASFQRLVLLAVAGAGSLSLAAFFTPLGKAERLRDVSSGRFDERDIMFARARLQPGSDRHKAYYAMRPENQTKDDLFRAQPGLLSPHAKYADAVLFAAPEASFALTDAMHTLVDGSPAARQVSLPANPGLTRFVKALARYFGALDVGVTGLRPEHVYSHIGRGAGEWGAPLEVEHKYAIAFTVEMDAGIMGLAPEAPVVMESARQYVEAGRIAVQLAQTIRAWGYPARAHMDGNYRVICPLVARDAGLGEIGRMGLLMTPRLGPRVRIAVVTTDLELIPDQVLPDASVIDFCAQCGKCAENCPPKAIPFTDRIEIAGALRWQINSDLCFRYWCAVGTDCGRCMSVCPYSHPDTFYHNLVRWGNARSAAFRRFALWADDLFYGKHPARPRPPAWLP